MTTGPNGEQRPSDAIGAAVTVARIATGEMEEQYAQPDPKPYVSTVKFNHIVTQEGNQFVSYCIELGTASCGDTVEEAMANITEAVELHLTALHKLGQMQRVFAEKGIATQIAPQQPPESPLPMTEFHSTTRHQVPVLAA